MEADDFDVLDLAVWRKHHLNICRKEECFLLSAL
jgi:hypothetical protein